MKRLPSKRPRGARPESGKNEDHPETAALMRKLDEVYERLRKRARAEWLRHHAGQDPSDASVRITSGDGNRDRRRQQRPGLEILN